MKSWGQFISAASHDKRFLRRKKGAFFGASMISVSKRLNRLIRCFQFYSSIDVLIFSELP
jgi:hypothetical protein